MITTTSSISSTVLLFVMARLGQEVLLYVAARRISTPDQIYIQFDIFRNYDKIKFSAYVQTQVTPSQLQFTRRIKPKNKTIGIHGYKPPNQEMPCMINHDNITCR